MLNISPYVRTVIDWDAMDKDWGHQYMYVSQRPYKGKPEAGLAPGATVTLQILTDAHDHGVDKSGRARDNNALETFSVTVVGCPYPLPLSKGDRVQLEGFIAEASYYIDYSPILRFREIKKSQQQQGGGKA